METLCSNAQKHALAKEAEKSFVDQCKAIEEELKDEEAAALDGLAKFLGEHPSAKLRSGKYLTLSRKVSMLKLTADRVEEAIARIDRTAVMQHKGASEADRIVAAIEEALRDACSKVTETPRVVKNAPKGLPKGKYTVSAPPAVEEMCEQLSEAKENLKKIKGRKKDGKQQVAPTLEATRKRVHEVMDALLPAVDAEPTTLNLEPEPEVQVDGRAVDLPALPMGDVPVMNQKKKRKTVTVPGLEKPIKVRRKPDKPKTVRPKVTIEAFADELSFVVREQYPTVAKFLKQRSDVIADAVELLGRLSAPEVSDSEGPATYSITIS